MDLFLATCQGIGLALAVGGAAGALAGIRGEVAGWRRPPLWSRSR